MRADVCRLEAADALDGDGIAGSPEGTKREGARQDGRFDSCLRARKLGEMGFESAFARRDRDEPPATACSVTLLLVRFPACFARVHVPPQTIDDVNQDAQRLVLAHRLGRLVEQKEIRLNLQGIDGRDAMLNERPGPR